MENFTLLLKKYADFIVRVGVNPQPGQTLTAQVRGRQIEAQVVALPFYKRNKG